MNLGLDGKRAIVGGATSGLGRATAVALADEGCNLVLWSSSQEHLDETAHMLSSRTSVSVTTVSADAKKPDTASRVAEAALAGGDVDIVVLNAGGPPPVDPTATTPEGWSAALQMLTLTPIMLATALLPGMRERGFGRVLAVLSSGVVEPIPNLAYSNAGRSALAAWLKTVSVEVAADGVTVNGVLPGRFDTPRVAALDRARAQSTGTSEADVRAASEQSIPAGRYGDPAEFGAFVAMLASTASGYITGRMHAADGGMLKSY
ncbi:MAG: 3-oxoacyl-[acyl-carrier protein] reductase [Frankiales bacterium]|jgi:3-oxoacyl-[acyl-carrier protein] reductase|nr:3-oxoacyl-[acyl-carrier protein] reductase [Frankiales bacterium]MDX6242633.1 3-oxoacyl-[acyl-carrier protein] reductase [Frankiales bacterium]